jgi:hypothetical protein
MVESDFNYAPETIKEEWNELFSKIETASLKVERQKWEHFTPEFLDTQTSDHEAIVDTIEAMNARRNLYASEKIGQLEAHVKLDSSMPITIFHIGDIHWGSIYTNNELWDYHRNKILETPGAYVLLYHNLVDNGIPAKFPSNTLANGVPPESQFRVMQTWLKELNDAGKILGAIDGDCHEGWSSQVAGVSVGKLLYGFEGRKFPLLENGGILYLGIGEQTYGIGMWHKQGPFNSRFNPEHALRQNRRLNHESKTDIEVGAHYHNAVASASWEGSKNDIKQVNWIRVGTYKGVPSFVGEEPNFITDKWAIDKFGTSGNPPAPSTTFWNNKHRFDSSLDFDTGLEKHIAIRSYALIKEMGLQDKFDKLMK